MLLPSFGLKSFLFFLSLIDSLVSQAGMIPAEDTSMLKLVRVSALEYQNTVDNEVTDP